MNSNYWAHVKGNENGSFEVHPLIAHLIGTANMASEFANTFSSTAWADTIGFWHDLGKYLRDWQAYLRRSSGFDNDSSIEDCNGRPNHSTAGAVLSFERYLSIERISPGKARSLARILSYCIAGHHAGLPDWASDEAGGDLTSRVFSNPLEMVLDKKELDEIRKIPEVEKILSHDLPKPSLINKKELKLEQFHLWVRMLFSCLVDADFLNTELFMRPDLAEKRGHYPNIPDLKSRFDNFMNEKKVGDTPINRQRNIILSECRAKSKEPPGFFSLTVPTGGGKTLSSMAFALEHAIANGKSRVIMAIPYTSIIEQTSKVYKYGTDDDSKIEEVIKNGKWLFGEDSVLEHHSNLDPEKETQKSRLSSENWDAPIIVTTNVQLFESIFASKTSSCRKMHNIVDSVIVLDEAQMLPPEYLHPLLSALKGLVEYFGVTVVFCTATQPALTGKIGDRFEGITNVKEIVAITPEMIEAFSRVEIETPADLNFCWEWEQMADELKKHEQVLCVVNTRTDCRKLHSFMPEGTIHLSANMCGEERSDVISRLKAKLKAGNSIRVISTQLVEAGVDIDFPVVYRAFAGLDSIAQSAGRCNREGRLNSKGKLGKVVVFQPPKPAPIGLLRKGEDTSKTLLRTEGCLSLSPDLYRKYFYKFYCSVNDFDKPRFVERMQNDAAEFKFQFRTFAQDFCLIDNSAQKSIIVLYEGNKNSSYPIIDLLRKKGPEPWILRKLQRFIVNIPSGCFERINSPLYLDNIQGFLVQREQGLYRPGLGLLLENFTYNDEYYIF